MCELKGAMLPSEACPHQNILVVRIALAPLRRGFFCPGAAGYDRRSGTTPAAAALRYSRGTASRGSSTRPARLRGARQVPICFSMRKWTRKRTFRPENDDWVILRDDLVVGRVEKDEAQTSRKGSEQWWWSVLTMPAQGGWASSLEEAQERVRDLASEKWGHRPHGWPVE